MATGISVDLKRRLQALEQRPEVLSAGLATVQPWLDIPEFGSSVLVTTDGQVQESTALRIVFEERGTLSRGVVELKSRCASCAGGNALSCEARLSFTAREEMLQE